MMDLVVHYVGFGFYTESEGKPLDYSEQRTSQEANIVTWEEKKSGDSDCNESGGYGQRLQ